MSPSRASFDESGYVARLTEKLNQCVDSCRNEIFTTHNSADDLIGKITNEFDTFSSHQQSLKLSECEISKVAAKTGNNNERGATGNISNGHCLSDGSAHRISSYSSGPGSTKLPLLGSSKDNTTSKQRSQHDQNLAAPDTPSLNRTDNISTEERRRDETHAGSDRRCETNVEFEYERDAEKRKNSGHCRTTSSLKTRSKKERCYFVVAKKSCPGQSDQYSRLFVDNNYFRDSSEPENDSSVSIISRNTPLSSSDDGGVADASATNESRPRRRAPKNREPETGKHNNDKGNDEAARRARRQHRRRRREDAAWRERGGSNERRGRRRRRSRRGRALSPPSSTNADRSSRCDRGGVTSESSHTTIADDDDDSDHDVARPKRIDSSRGRRRAPRTSRRRTFAAEHYHRTTTPRTVEARRRGDEPSLTTKISALAQKIRRKHPPPLELGGGAASAGGRREKGRSARTSARRSDHDDATWSRRSRATKEATAHPIFSLEQTWTLWRTRVRTKKAARKKAVKRLMVAMRNADYQVKRKESNRFTILLYKDFTSGFDRDAAFAWGGVGEVASRFLSFNRMSLFWTKMLENLVGRKLLLMMQKKKREVACKRKLKQY